MDQAGAFTISSDHQIIEDQLKYAIRYESSAHEIRARLARQDVEGTDRRAVFVGEAEYMEKGGAIERDLFSEMVLFKDEELLDQLVYKKLSEEAELIRTEKGARWVECHTEMSFHEWESSHKPTKSEKYCLNEDQQARLNELSAQEDCLDDKAEAELNSLNNLCYLRVYDPDHLAISGYVVYVDYSGKLGIKGPYIRKEDITEAVTVNALPKDVEKELQSQPNKDNNVLSQALKSDMQAIRLHAFQSAFLQDPTKVLSLLAYSLSHFGRYSGLFDLNPTYPTNVPSVDNGFTPNKKLLGKSDSTSPEDVELGYAEFAQKSAEEIQIILTSELVRTLATGFGFGSQDRKDLFEAFGTAMNVNPRQHWTPTKENFWKRINSSQLDEIFAEMTGFAPDNKVMAEFLKLKKGEKADKLHMLFNDTAYQGVLKLTKKQLKAIADWWPSQAN